MKFKTWDGYMYTHDECATLHGSHTCTFVHRIGNIVAILTFVSKYVKARAVLQTGQAR